MSNSDSTLRFCPKCQAETERPPSGACRPCSKVYQSARYAANAEKAKAYSASYRVAHPEKVKAAVQAWRDANQQYIKDSKAIYRAEKPEVEKASQAAYRAANKVKTRRATAVWREKNTAHLSDYGKRKWPKIKEKKLARDKKRYQEDPIYSMCVNVRNRTAAAFKGKGFSKGSKTFELLGCDWDTLKIHIEKQFVSGMNWRNKSTWHVDHIVPIGNAKTIDEIKSLCHFTNLRPLWAVENKKKSSKNVFLI